MNSRPLIGKLRAKREKTVKLPILLVLVKNKISYVANSGLQVVTSGWHKDDNSSSRCTKTTKYDRVTCLQRRLGSQFTTEGGGAPGVNHGVSGSKKAPGQIFVWLGSYRFISRGVFRVGNVFSFKLAARCTGARQGRPCFRLRVQCVVVCA